MQTPAPRAPLPPTSPWPRSIHTTDTSKSSCTSAVSGWGLSPTSRSCWSHFFGSASLSAEAHSPLVILERGRFSFGQYEEQISSRRDFIRCTRKDSEPERKVGTHTQTHTHTSVRPFPRHPKAAQVLTRRRSCRPPAAGVCEEATPQGHSEQPRPDAELLSQPAARTVGDSQSRQRAAVSGGPQRKHERHQDPRREGETRGPPFRPFGGSATLILPCSDRKPW